MSIRCSAGICPRATSVRCIQSAASSLVIVYAITNTPTTHRRSCTCPCDFWYRTGNAGYLRVGRTCNQLLQNADKFKVMELGTVWGRLQMLNPCPSPESCCLLHRNKNCLMSSWTSNSPSMPMPTPWSRRATSTRRRFGMFVLFCHSRKHRPWPAASSTAG